MSVGGSGVGPVYGSNKVNYRQNIIPRNQLMEMRKTLLEKCEEVISYTPWPFTRNNLTTAKIFNDLLQFHGDYTNAAPFYNQPSVDGSIQSGGSKGALLKGQYTPTVGRNGGLASSSVGAPAGK